MKHIFSVFFVFFITFHLVSQTQISGKIIDENGEPLFGATISTDKMEGAVSDFDGNYSLKLSPGVITLTISSIGFEMLKEGITIDEGEQKTFDFTLKEEQVKVEDIVVYGSKRGKLIQEEVQSVEVVQTELLENNNVTSGLEAVELMSGVTVLDGQMSIRGGSGYAYGVGSRVILVVDEIPMLSSERGEINWDLIPTENVEQMELLKGGGAVQYGTSALNGILNVRTAWAKKKHETQVTVYNSFIGKPRVKEANWWKDENSYIDIPHKLGLTFSHRRKMAKNVDLSFSGVLHSFQSHLKDEFNERARFNFNIRHRSDKIKGLALGLYTSSMYKNDSFFFIWKGNNENSYLPLATYGKRYIYNVFHPFVSYYDEKGNTFKYNGAVYLDNMARKNAKNNSAKIYNDFQYQKKFKFNLGLIAGVTTENNFIQAPVLRGVAFPDAENSLFKYSQYSIYLLADYKYRNLSLSGGARYEIISLDQNTISSKPVFSLGANYKLTKNDYLRISFNQSYRIPNVAERYVDESLGPINIYPNPEIKPETGFTSEIGYKRLLNNKKWRGFADVAIYLTEFDDMVEFNFGNHTQEGDTAVALGFKAENVARARVFGWEFSFEEKGTIGKFDVTARLGYTYAYAVDLNQNKKARNIGNTIGNAFKSIYISDRLHKEFELNPSGVSSKNPLKGMLKYRFRHTLKMDLAVDYKRFGLGTNLAYYSYMDNVDEVFKLFIPGAVEYREAQKYRGDLVLDLRAKYSIPDKVSFFFIIENVLNNDYSIRPTKPNAPRSFTFKTNFKF